jgi:hypothetical protein
MGITVGNLDSTTQKNTFTFRVVLQPALFKNTEPKANQPKN